MSVLDLISVEYSPGQSCYHISTLWEVMRNNGIAANKGNQSRVLAAGGFRYGGTGRKLCEKKKGTGTPL